MKSNKKFYMGVVLGNFSLVYIGLFILMLVTTILTSVYNTGELFCYIIDSLYFLSVILYMYSYSHLLDKIEGTYELQYQVVKIMNKKEYLGRQYKNIMLNLIGFKIYHLYCKMSLDGGKIWKFRTFKAISLRNIKEGDEIRLMNLNYEDIYAIRNEWR